MRFGRSCGAIFFTVLLTSGALSGFGQPTNSANVTLAWDPSISPNIATYRLYYGNSSGNYTNISETGNVTLTTVSNLLVGSTYYFAVSAVDIIGLESVLSSEVSYTVGAPLGATLQLTSNPGQGAVISASGPAGYSYDLITSTDLLTWSTIVNLTTDTNGTLQFTDPDAATNAARFYRLRQTSP